MIGRVSPEDAVADKRPFVITIIAAPIAKPRAPPSLIPKKSTIDNFGPHIVRANGSPAFGIVIIKQTINDKGINHGVFVTSATIDGTADGTETSDFIFIMSINGDLTAQPNGKFYGSMAGKIEIQYQPGTEIHWRDGVVGLNFPDGDMLPGIKSYIIYD